MMKPPTTRPTTNIPPLLERPCAPCQRMSGQIRRHNEPNPDARTTRPPCLGGAPRAHPVRHAHPRLAAKHDGPAGSPLGDRAEPGAEPEPVPITGALQAAPHGIQVCQVPTRIVLSYLMLWVHGSRSQRSPPGANLLMWPQPGTDQWTVPLAHTRPTAAACSRIRRSPKPGFHQRTLPLPSDCSRWG
jgi:hypothetical protein